MREENPNKLYQPIRMQGQHYDAESNLHYNRHRYYDPNIGRYISQDPIGLEGGINNYVYPLNPNQVVDPLGLHPALIWGGRAAWIGVRYGIGEMSSKIAYGIRVANGSITVDGSIMTDERIEEAKARAREKSQTEDRVKSCTITQTHAKSCPPCEPPAGTPCHLGPHTDHSHKGMMPHYHSFQMNQRPAPDCSCEWNKRNSAKDTYPEEPDFMQPCGIYPSFNK